MNDTDNIERAESPIDAYTEALREAIDRLNDDNARLREQNTMLDQKLAELDQRLDDASSEATALRVNEQNLTERLAAGEPVAHAMYRGRDVEADHGGALIARLSALLAATPQPAAEPVAVAISYDGVSPYKLSEYGDGPLLDLEIKRLGGAARKMYLYTHPQPQPAQREPAQREWIGLTDEDLRDLFTQQHAFNRLGKFFRVIEDKLREKNGSKP